MLSKSIENTANQQDGKATCMFVRIFPLTVPSRQAVRFYYDQKLKACLNSGTTRMMSVEVNIILLPFVMLVIPYNTLRYPVMACDTL